MQQGNSPGAFQAHSRQSVFFDSQIKCFSKGLWQKSTKPSPNQAANAQVNQKVHVWYSDKQLRYHFCSPQLPFPCFPRGAAAASQQDSLTHCLLEKHWHYNGSHTSCDFGALNTYRKSLALICSPYPWENWIHGILPWICCGILPKNSRAQGVCDLIAIWLESESFPYQLPERVNPSQRMEESPYGMMSAEKIYLSPIQILTPASAEYSSMLTVRRHKSCFIWYILEKI